METAKYIFSHFSKQSNESIDSLENEFISFYWTTQIGVAAERDID